MESSFPFITFYNTNKIVAMVKVNFYIDICFAEQIKKIKH